MEVDHESFQVLTKHDKSWIGNVTSLKFSSFIAYRDRDINKDLLIFYVIFRGSWSARSPFWFHFHVITTSLFWA